MKLIQHIESGDAQILITDIPDNSEVLKGQLKNFEAYRSQYETLGHEKRKREFLSARIALNQLLNSQVVVEYDMDRKPFINDNPVHISISHSTRYLAVITHPEAIVGIDIEEISSRVCKVYRRFLSAEEQSYLLPDDIQALQIAWSAKECLYKMIGKASSDFAATLRLHPFDGSPSEGSLQADCTINNENYTLHYQREASYLLVYGIKI